MAAIEEAVTIQRALARVHPDAFGPVLAISLNTLSIRLSDLGRQEDGLAAIEEAVTIFRGLAQAHPEAFGPDLASSLHNLSIWLGNLGRREDALAAIEEAVAIRRELAAKRPGAHRQDLADSLQVLALLRDGENLSNTAQEAIDTYRLLARDNPDAHRPRLAAALNNLGDLLAEAGDWKAALAFAQEAADMYRQLADDNPDVHLPGLAMALDNLGDLLTGTGQQRAALAPAQEAVDTYRQLARDDPDAHLPGLAASLTNLGELLADTRQRQAALAPTQEAVTIRQQLARDDPDGYLLGLVGSLDNLSDQLARAGRKAEVAKVWESAIAGFPEASSRLALTVGYAAHLLSGPDANTGTDLLIAILATPELAGQVEADARGLLREHWRQHPRAVDRAWQSAGQGPVPEWMCLTGEHINTVIDWINSWIYSEAWAESHDYFQDHADQLLTDATVIVLDELALTAPEDVISQHRVLLNEVREHGLDAAYRPLLHLADIVREWIATPDWDASRSFLHDHPELLGEDVPGILESLNDGPDRATILCQALLTLARGTAGVDGAYQGLQDKESLQVIVTAAIETRDRAQVWACSQIEAIMQGRAFTGALHMILSWLLADPPREFPDGWADELRTLAAQSDSADRDTALAQFSAALVGIRVDIAVASQLEQILAWLTTAEGDHRPESGQSEQEPYPENNREPDAETREPGELKAPANISDRDIKPDNGGFHHYVDKNAIQQAISAQQPVEALCGWKWVPRNSRQDSNYPGGLPACPACKDIYDSLPSE